jgi:hypothetical protein
MTFEEWKGGLVEASVKPQMHSEFDFQSDFKSEYGGSILGPIGSENWSRVMREVLEQYKKDFEMIFA